jgi:hypothetical protein
VTIAGGTVTATGGKCGAGIGGGYYGNGGTVTVRNHPTVIATGQNGAADVGNGTYGTGATNIRHDTPEGTDLTYIRLELQDLSPDNTYKIIFHEYEHEINNVWLTGYFAEKSTESHSVRLEPAGAVMDISPGDIQNSRITLKKNDYADPVAGFGNALDFPAKAQSRIDVPINDDTKIGGRSDFTISIWISPDKNEPYQTLYRQYNQDTGSLGVWLRFIKSAKDEGYLYFGFDAPGGWYGGWQWAWDWNNGLPPADITRIPTGRWSHVALAKTGKNAVLYVNGTRYYEMTLDDKHYNTLKPNGGSISFGGTSADDQFFNGRMDEPRWNNRIWR